METIKRIWTHRIGKRICIALIALVALACSIWYGCAFFETGIALYDTFFVESTDGNMYYYDGNTHDGPMRIAVEHMGEIDKDITIHFTYPSGKELAYTVQFGELNDDMFFAMYPVTITRQDGKVLLQAMYAPDEAFPLWKEDGTPYWDDAFDVVVTTTTSNEHFKSSHESSNTTLARLAFSNYSHIRGNIGFLLFALIVAGTLAIDVRFPLFFFTWQHIFSVRDPEPSDFYLAMQKLSWFVFFPACILFCLIAALHAY